MEKLSIEDKYMNKNTENNKCKHKNKRFFIIHDTSTSYKLWVCTDCRYKWWEEK